MIVFRSDEKPFKLKLEVEVRLTIKHVETRVNKQHLSRILTADAQRIELISKNEKLKKTKSCIRMFKEKTWHISGVHICLISLNKVHHLKCTDFSNKW